MKTFLAVLRTLGILGLNVVVLGMSVVAYAEDAVVVQNVGGDNGEDVLVFGMDLVPFVGASTFYAKHRRILSLNLVGGISSGIDAIEIGAGFNYTRGYLYGLQVAGATNFVRDGGKGVQIAGGTNVVTGNLEGLQVSSVTNVVHGDMDGAQISLTNITTGSLNGVQIGLVNVAGSSSEGAQIALVNVTNGHVEGTQIGLINYASSANRGIGLINFYTDGWWNLETFASEDGLVMMGLRHGFDSFYTTYAVGTLVLGDDLNIVAGIGFGKERKFTKSLAGALDFFYSGFISTRRGWSPLNRVSQTRALLSWQMTENVALYGGPTLNVGLRRKGDESRARWKSLNITHKDVRYGLDIWPGMTVGLRLF